MNKTLKTTIPDRPESIRLIPVPSEKMEGKKSEYKYIQDDSGNKYEILQTYTFEKNEVFPGGLMLLATGQKIKSVDIWEKYKNSEYIYFFVCKEVKNEK